MSILPIMMANQTTQNLLNQASEQSRFTRNFNEGWNNSNQTPSYPTLDIMSVKQRVNSIIKKACPSCGAPIKSNKCEYCESEFFGMFDNNSSSNQYGNDCGGMCASTCAGTCTGTSTGAAFDCGEEIGEEDTEDDAEDNDDE